MIRTLRSWLVDPNLRGLDVDGVDFSLVHREILQRKPMLQSLFLDFYRELRRLDERHLGACPGARIEIGSGSSFLKQVYPDVLATDYKPLPSVDLVLRAEEMPFRDDSLRCIYAINVFHHLSDPRAFFRELLRVLHPGGGALLLEPWWGWLARIVFKHLHASEGFDLHAPDWESPASGPFSRANQALSYVVFRRDRRRFESEFPGLEVVVDRPHTHLRYLLSGGVNFRQLVPDLVAPMVTFAERLLSPFDRLLALQHTMLIRKRLQAGPGRDNLPAPDPCAHSSC